MLVWAGFAAPGLSSMGFVHVAMSAPRILTRPSGNGMTGSEMRIGTRLKDWARAIKRDVVALYIAGRDPRVPWSVKAVAVAIAAYALSPIDLVPDFIPVLGYLDELILLPIAITLVVRMIPESLMAEFREEAQRRSKRPTSRTAAAAIIALWIAAAVFLLSLFWPPPTREASLLRIGTTINLLE